MIETGLHIGKWVWRVAASVLAMVVVAIAVLAIRLQEGPIEIGRLRDHVEAALQPSDRSYRIAIGRTELAWEGWQEGVRLQAREIRFSRPDGTDLAAVPSVSVRIGIGAMLMGEIALKELTLANPQLRLMRREDGRLALGIVESERSGRPTMVGLLQALARDRSEREQGPLAELESVRIVGGDLVVDDANLGREWRAAKVEGRLARDQEGIDVRLSFELLVDGRTVPLSATGHHRRADGSIALALNFADLSPSLFAAARGPLRALAWFDTPLSGRVDLAMRDNGRVESARFDLKGTRGRLAIPGYYDRPLDLADFALSGALTENGRRLDIAAFRIQTDGPVLTTAGTFRGDEENWDYAGRFALANVVAADIARFWPNGLKPSTRQWLVENVTEGRVDHLDLELALRKRPDKVEPLVVESVKGGYRFRGATIRYLRHLPPVSQVAGTGTFDDKDLRFAVESGSSEGVKVTGGRVEILGVDRPREDVIIEARLEGKLGDKLRLLDRRPLGFASALGVNPASVGGDARSTIVVRFKLHDNVGFDEIAIEAEAELEKLHWRKGLFGLDLSEGRFRLAVSKAGMVLSGESQLAEETAAIKWSEAFARTASPRRTIEVKTRFRSETLAGLGLDVRQNLRGSVEADLKIVGTDDGRTAIDGVYDFADAALTLPAVHVAKPAGMPATGRALVTLHGHRVVSVTRFSLDSAAVQAAGSVQFHPDGATIRSLELSRFIAGRTNIRAQIQGEKDGAKTVRIDGPTLELAPLLRQHDAGAEARMPAFRLSGHLGRLYVSGEHHVADVTGEALFDGEHWRRLKAQGKVGRGASLVFSLEESANQRSLSIKGSDAGAALKAFDVTETVVGGELEITASAASRGWSGEMSIRELRVVRAPVLARLLALASLDGIANLTASDAGLALSEIRMPFRLLDGVLDIKEGRAQGSNIGFTAAGRVDLRRETTELSGTVVPLHLLNGMIGKIPVLGQVLVGEKGGGLVAARFTLSGPFARPDIQVNPLSLVTVGPFRRIFDLPGTGQADLGTSSNGAPAAPAAVRPPPPAPPPPSAKGTIPVLPAPSFERLSER